METRKKSGSSFTLVTAIAIVGIAIVVTILVYLFKFYSVGKNKIIHSTDIKENSEIFMDSLDSEERVIKNYEIRRVMEISTYKFDYKRGISLKNGRYQSTSYYDEYGRITEEENSNNQTLVFKYGFNNKCSEYYSLQSFYEYWNESYRDFLYRYVNQYNKNDLLITRDIYKKNRLIEKRINEYDNNNFLVYSKIQSVKGRLLAENRYEYNARGFVDKISTITYPGNGSRNKVNYFRVNYHNSSYLVDSSHVYKEGILQFKYVYKYEFYDDHSNPQVSFEDFSRSFMYNAFVSYDKFKSYCDSRLYTTECDRGERITTSAEKIYAELNNLVRGKKYEIGKDDISRNEIVVQFDDFYKLYFTFRKKGGLWKLYYYMLPC